MPSTLASCGCAASFNALCASWCVVYLKALYVNYLKGLSTWLEGLSTSLLERTE